MSPIISQENALNPTSRLPPDNRFTLLNISHDDDDDDGGEDANHDNADKTLTIIIMMTTIIRRSKFVRDGGSDE